MPRSSRGNDRERRLRSYLGDEVQVVPTLGPVGVHAVQHELSRPPLLTLDEPRNGVHLRVQPATVQVDLPTGTALAPSHVHAQDHTLAPEALGALVHKVRSADGGAVYGDLVGPGTEHGAHIRDGSNATTDSVGYEDL